MATDDRSPANADHGARPNVGAGLLVGALAVAAAVVARPAFSFPFGGLLLAAGMAWGVLSLLRLAATRDARIVDDALVAALAPYLGVPVLARLLAHRTGEHLPAWAEATVAPHVLLVAAALGLVVALRATRWGASSVAPAVVVGGLGVAALALLLVAHARLPPAAPLQSALLVTFAVGAVAVTLLVQWTTARRALVGRFAVFGSAAALAAAASQLLDGIVTYLAVVDPLGLAARPLREQVPLSALLLETTGIGYPIVKWGIALLVVYALDVSAAGRGGTDASSRALMYLVVVLVGLGPGLFSTVQVLR